MENTGLRLLSARAELKERGSSPRKRAYEKIYDALDLVYRFGFSSPTIIDSLAGTKRRGLTAKLVKAGLFVSTKTKAGSILPGIPDFFITLTEAGVTEAERNREKLLDYELDPYQVNQANLRHDLLAQGATATNLRLKKIVGYITDRELTYKQKSSKNVKQADVVWIMSGNQKFAVEIELSARFGQKLDEFVLKIILSLTATPEKPASFKYVLIVSDSEGILTRYKEAFSAESKVNMWAKNRYGHWKIDKTIAIPAFIERSISWVKL